MSLYDTFSLFHLAALNCNSSDVVFRNFVYHTSTLSYSIGSRPISYSRARELLLNSLVELGSPTSKGELVWDQSGIRIIGIMRVSVCLGAILIPEYLDFHSGYSAPRSRIAGIYSGIYSYSGISQTNAP